MKKKKPQKFRIRSLLFRLSFVKHCVLPALCVGQQSHRFVCLRIFYSNCFKNVPQYSRLLCGGGLNVDAGGQLTTCWFHKRPQIDRRVCVCSRKMLRLVLVWKLVLLGVVEGQNTLHYDILFYLLHIMKW